MKQIIKERIEQISRREIPIGYKLTDIGIVPVEWEVKRMKNLGSFSKGKGLPGAEMKSDGIPCIGYGDIYTKYNYKFDKALNYVEQEIANESVPVQKGTLMFTCSGETAIEIGKCVCYIGDETIYVGGDIAIFQPNNKVDPLFVAYQQNAYSSIKQKARLGQGHSVVHIYSDSLGKLAVAFPKDIKEQQKISEILSRWDEAISLQEDLIRKLDIQKRALIQKLFTPKEGGKEMNLGDVVSKEKAKLLKNTPNGIYPIIDMEFLANNKFVNFANDIGLEATEKDVLILWDGSGAGLPIYNIRGMIGSTFSKLTPKKNILPGFLYYFLLSVYEKNKNLREGSGVPHVPKDFLKMQKIFIPPLHIQNSVVIILTHFENEIDLQSKKLKTLQIQQKSLQQLLLTGILRVN